MWARGQAMDSSVEQGAQSLSSTHARPLAAATPMRSPVKDPGPAATATTSTSGSVCPLLTSILSTMGSSVRLWVRPLFCPFWAKMEPSSHSAAEQAVAEDSMANIFIGLSP